MTVSNRTQTSGMRHLRVALAQIDVTVGDLEGNVALIKSYMDRANHAGSDLVAFPELALTGYPPEDLLLKPGFINANLQALEELADATRAYPNLTAVVGFVDRLADLYNAAAILHRGVRAGTYHKQYLPNYGVFDEDRYFSAGRGSQNFVIADVVVGINICEDIWYPNGPHMDQVHNGAEVLLNISASPFNVKKQQDRERMLSIRASDTGAVVAYLNLVGGQDELVFDGSSIVIDGRGNLLARASAFHEDLLIVDLDVDEVFRARLHDPRRRKLPISDGSTSENRIVEVSHRRANSRPVAMPGRLGHDQANRIAPALGPLEEAYTALVMGTRDYVRKNGFREAVVALSGGIDSALTAAIAVDALGNHAVTGVSMPSRYSSVGSKDDARTLAQNLGIKFVTLPIHGMFDEALTTLEPVFASAAPTTSTLPEENVQARLRGLLLMAISNRVGSIVLTTGNKSEMAVGYATLYGDMAGGFAVLKDVFKTVVYDLARWRNEQAGTDLIPLATIEKPPSAELRPDQRDSDSLPPYEELDPILKAYVEDDHSFEEITALGHRPDVVRQVMRLVDRSEYKRRQAPPGIKITGRAFGRDRRLPLTSSSVDESQRSNADGSEPQKGTTSARHKSALA